MPHPPNGVIRCGIDFRTREGAAVNAWKVCCGKCQHSWTLLGNWSVYEREALESRPCPKCHSYTLSSPEPSSVKPRLRRPQVRVMTTVPVYKAAG